MTIRTAGLIASLSISAHLLRDNATLVALCLLVGVGLVVSARREVQRSTGPRRAPSPAVRAGLAVAMLTGGAAGLLLSTGSMLDGVILLLVGAGVGLGTVALSRRP